MTLLLDSWAYVAAVGVREDRRGQGVAQALVRRAEEIGRQARRSWMVLEVDAGNGPARSLYSKLGWNAGAKVRWWDLQSTAPGGNAPSARGAVATEVELAHSASVQRLGQEFPSRFLHPCELACRGMGGPHETFAAGPAGAPTLVLRYWAGRAGESGFLLPVATGEPPHVDEASTLEAGRSALLSSGSKGLFIPVLGEDPHLDGLLRRAGGAHIVDSEFWWKRVGS